MRQRFKKVAEAVYFGPKPEPVAPLPATIPVSMQKRYWTKKRCKEEAAKYETLKDFRKNSYAYNATLKNGWIGEICSHMQRASKPAGYWTKKRCIKEARKHKTFSQFRKNCASAYAIAWRNGWLDEIHEIFGNKERKGRKV